MMTYKELLEKNARTRALRAQMIAEEEAKKPAKKVKLPKEEIKEEPIKVEEEIAVEEQPMEEEVEEISAEESPKTPAKRGRKPANRAYMVVEDIEEVNKD